MQGSENSSGQGLKNRVVIINADDFGLSTGVNRGILEAAERGILTSASLMVRQPAAAEAARLARSHPRISIGLHLDLGEWVLRNGDWQPLYSVVDTNDSSAVAKEVSHQLAEFKRLIGKPPTHLDSHQHVHRQEPVRSLLTAEARRLGVPLREFTPGIGYCGDFYGQGAEGESLPGVLTLDGLRKILVALPRGINELGCHPGYADGLKSPYRLERTQELQVLCNPSAREILDELQIQLISFGNFDQRTRPKRASH